MQQNSESHAQYIRAVRARRLRVIITVAVTMALCAAYIVADATGLVHGVITTDPVSVRTLGAPQETIPAADFPGRADTGKTIDTERAQTLVDALTSADGVGSDVSVAIAQTDGTIVASHELTAPREPASTMKTLTSLAAASQLNMGSTLATNVYVTNEDPQSASIVLQGNGDMLLSSGQSDPNHVNGRAGLATLANQTAAALGKRGITSVKLAYDDTLFGTQRYPERVGENNGDNLYYTGVSSMAIDGGRQWNGNQPADPDLFEAYPPLSQNTAQDTANMFAAKLRDAGITVTGGVSGIDNAGHDKLAKLEPVAQVRSATLSSIMRFMLRHSDNTLAEEFGRLLAIHMHEDNSPQGATTAVRRELETLHIPTGDLQMADCSGLSPGSHLTVETLVSVQERNLTPGNAVAAAEGLSIPGLVGTAEYRLASANAAGLMRVKTGSLSQVTALTGNVSRQNGGVAAFSIVINNPKDVTKAKAAMNTFMAGLTKL